MRQSSEEPPPNSLAFANVVPRLPEQWQRENAGSREDSRPRPGSGRQCHQAVQLPRSARPHRCHVSAFRAGPVRFEFAPPWPKQETTPTELKLLTAFVRNKGRVLTRDKGNVSGSRDRFHMQV